jgi:membrane fusion protein (multidrug efflux system)
MAAALAVAACNRPAPAKPEARQAPPLPADVQAIAAAASPAQAAAASPAAEAKDAFSGEFRSPVHSELVSKVSGRVGRIHVDEGAFVRKGQPLLELEKDYLQLDVQRTEAELARAQAAASDAEKDFERKKGLAAKESVAQAVFDRSQAAAQGAAGAYHAAQAALELARQRLSDAVLTSPIDGVVVERRIDVGERLGDNTVAFLIQQMAPLKLRFRVPERYLGRARVGMPVKASVDPYPGQPFAGRVAVVGSAIDPLSRSFFVEAEFQNGDGRLKPGLFARIEFDLGGGE